MKTFTLLYPEHRVVSGATIRMWFNDAVANRETDKKGPLTIEEMARELSNIGHITLKRD